jgi:hypothetical protein
MKYDKGKDIGIARDVVGHVTFKAFRSLMAKRHYGLDDLVPMFRGQLDEPRELLARILKVANDTDGTVIPYRCLLKFYHQELASQGAVRGGRK